MLEMAITPVIKLALARDYSNENHVEDGSLVAIFRSWRAPGGSPSSFFLYLTPAVLRYPPAHPGAAFGLAPAVCIQWIPSGRRLCFGACLGDFVYSDGLPIGVALFLVPAWAFLLAAVALNASPDLAGRAALLRSPRGRIFLIFYAAFQPLRFRAGRFSPGFDWRISPALKQGER